MEYQPLAIPWVSFCMSTFKRPLLLKKQLEAILTQTFPHFEVVVSDNDPEKSAAAIVNEIGDPRLIYYPNVENLGMVKSYNKSIERAKAAYIIMITDDDPVLPDMLDYFHHIVQKYAGYGIYIACSRVGKKDGEVEIFDNQNFLFQVLHPALTSNILWSSCLLRKDVLLGIGGMPDYGSPHLADHLMMAMCGTINGGVMINKMFSHLTSHDNNFSKTNIDLYYVACREFHQLITASVKKELYIKNGENALLKHLERWFLATTFPLRKYFTYSSNKKDDIRHINAAAKAILQLPFMKPVRKRYYFKLVKFNFKKPFYLLNLLR